MEANINVFGNWWMPVLGDLNETAISLKEVGDSVNEMKSGKALGLDEFPVECLKKGGMAVLEWLVRLLNLSFHLRVVPMEWRGACIVPLYKGRVTNVNVVKQFGRVLIKRVKAGTECAIG